MIENYSATIGTFKCNLGALSEIMTHRLTKQPTDRQIDQVIDNLHFQQKWIILAESFERDASQKNSSKSHKLLNHTQKKSWL